MLMTLATTLLSGLVLLVVTAAPAAAQSRSLEDELRAIGEELREPGTPSPRDETDDPRWEDASDASLEDALLSVPRNLDLPFEEYAKSASLPSGPDKVATNLLQLVDGHRAKSGFDLAEQAEELGIPYDGGRAGVRLFAESAADAAVLRDRIEAQGGEVLATFDNVVYARLPLGSVKSLGTANELHFMGPEPVYRPMAPNPDGGYGDQVSEGVRMTQVARLHRAGITGDRVKVGILDFGFERYPELVAAGELPEAQATRAFNRSQRIYAGSVHGTGCAEIIADMAPKADLYLAGVDGAESQIVQAAMWLAQQDVDIINFSGGGHGGPHNGKALLDRLVAHIVSEYDVLWVNAAGNEGTSHWTQPARDRNGNGAIDNVSGYPDVIALRTNRHPFKLLVVWDDWGPDPQRPSSSQDIDAYLLQRSAGGELRPVAESRQVQNGRGVPVEVIVSSGTPAGTVLYLALHLRRVQRPVRVHVFAMGAAEMFPVVSDYSVGIPATSAAALAVGAIDVRRDQLEDFSSRGPTDDRRQKPEVSAPDNTTSLAYSRNGGRFPGTSAAAPHVAGFAALLKQLQPQRSAPELRQAVLSHVTPRGNPTPNHLYGHGRIDAANIALSSDEEEPTPGGGDGGDGGEMDLDRILRDILRQQQ